MEALTDDALYGRCAYACSGDEKLCGCTQREYRRCAYGTKNCAGAHTNRIKARFGSDVSESTHTTEVMGGKTTKESASSEGGTRPSESWFRHHEETNETRLTCAHCTSTEVSWVGGSTTEDAWTFSRDLGSLHLRFGCLSCGASFKISLHREEKRIIAARRIDQILK